jgi:hypothetical protein
MDSLRLAEIYASMLAEVGVDGVSAASLMAQPQLIEPPSSPPPEEPEFRSIPSFVHMQQLQPERSYVPYKRMTHFIQHLAQLTGRNGAGAEMDEVRTRVLEAGVAADDTMAYFKIRALMKTWGYTSPHYRRIFAMLKTMGGKVLTLSYQQEMALRHDFVALCEVFKERMVGRTQRKNFISYYLIIQLLLSKYRIVSYYKLPSVKDSAKFHHLLDMYRYMVLPLPKR